MINLKNTNVVLTGATGGIGNSILENLVNAEANVVATGTNDEKLNAIKNKYKLVKVEKFDISKHNEIENFVNKVSDKFEKHKHNFNRSNRRNRKFYFRKIDKRRS